MALSSNYGLQNLTFIPEQPRENIPGYLSAADIAFIPLKKMPLFSGVLPSKLFDAWSCERPVILGVDGEARQVLESIQGGIYTSPEDAFELAQTIRWAKAHPEDCTQMGANGRTYTVQNHSHPELARKLLAILTQAINRD
jgi:glycosyltransferase involved in cell wall biosynthesis